MKISTACLQCRTGKRKCSSRRSGDSCNPCLKKKIPCSNQAHGRQLKGQPTAGYPLSQAPCDAIQPPYSEEIIYLVDLYFEYIHDKPHTLFHPPSLKASIADGTVSRTVLLSMIGLSARYEKATPNLETTLHERK
jgi:hypothetical protein